MGRKERRDCLSGCSEHRDRSVVSHHSPPCRKGGAVGAGGLCSDWVKSGAERLFVRDFSVGRVI
jgi:hypothetical protein